ncbi:RNA-binding domain-containing protein [Leisingera caerulea]|uniref:RNA-binding domain-containing protein n=1 Tax=Leisingera caerulea TaxID=506591 RepID=UPI0021A53CBB|nr:RNA-binding domain-containing protein [Leisingera caerulea]UWQ50845.1 putative DNA binding domain-containing protein [Leisingera caerulea]
MREELLILAESAITEEERVDFKREFSPEKKTAFWVETVKDIVAMANTNGGILIFGVNDDGSCSEYDCTPLLSFDPARITDQINKYTGVQFSEFQISEVVRSNGKFPAILVLPTRMPIVFCKVGSYEVEPSKQKTAFSVGTLYFRHGAKSEPASQADIANSFNRELGRVREEWLGNIRKVVEAAPGASVIISETSSSKTTVRLTRDPSAPAVRVKDLTETHPYRQTEVIKEIKKAVGRPIKFNGHDIRSIRHFENIGHASHPDFLHKPHELASPQYSESFVDFVSKRVLEDKEYLKKCRTSLRESKSA